MTAAEELVLIDAALTKIYTAAAQSIGARERQLTFLAIKDLTKRKGELENVIAGEDTGGTALVRFGERV